jgi:hypothetical protein
MQAPKRWFGPSYSVTSGWAPQASCTGTCQLAAGQGGCRQGYVDAGCRGEQGHHNSTRVIDESPASPECLLAKGGCRPLLRTSMAPSSRVPGE